MSSIELEKCESMSVGALCRAVVDAVTRKFCRAKYCCAR